MIQIIKKNWLSLIMLTLVISLGVGTRFYFLEKHFAHIDDIGVATTILDRQQYMGGVVNRYDKWRLEVLNGKKGTDMQSAAIWLDSISMLKEVAHFGLWWRNYLHAVPGGWTYAPGQFYLTNILINPGQNYSESKFWGRLPSFIFNVLAIGLLIILFVRLHKGKNSFPQVVLSATMLSLSWENIIYSAQMESYGVVSFSILLVLLHLLYIVDNPVISNKGNFLRGVLLAIPGLLQYQAIVFIAPLYITIIWRLRGRVSVTDLVKSTLFSAMGFFTIFLLLVWPYLKGNSDRGITWNAGPNHEFILNINWESGFYSVFSDVINFLIVRTPEVLEAMLSPVAYYIPESQLIGWLIFTFSMLGVVSMLLSKNSRKNTLVIFLLLSIVTWVILLILQILPLSPTRHSMVLGIFAIVLFVEGFFAFVKFFKIAPKYNIGGIQIITLIFVFSWATLFINTVNFAFDNRTDTFNEKELLQRLDNDKVDVIVVFDSTRQLYLMPSIIGKYPALEGNVWMTDGLKNISNYGKKGKITIKEKFRIAIISSWGCFNLSESKEELNAILNYYKIDLYQKSSIVKQICKDSGVEIEWSTRTTNGRNGFYYTVVDLHK